MTIFASLFNRRRPATGPDATAAEPLGFLDAAPSSFDNGEPDGREDASSRFDDDSYNFAYLDENTKRMIRRAILKAVAIPGYQVPFASREMPMPYGWGTGGVQVTAACLKPDDTLKVIDQGADDTTNAVSLRQFFEKDRRRYRDDDRNCRRRRLYRRATAFPEEMTDGWIRSWSTRCRSRSRFGFWSRARRRTRKMHALEEYGLMHVKLYEDIARHGRIATTYAYPVKVGERYVMDPSPIPKFDNPKLSELSGGFAALRRWARAADLRFAAPYTKVSQPRFRRLPIRSLAIGSKTAPFAAPRTAISTRSSQTIAGGAMFVCSDTDFL